MFRDLLVPILKARTGDVRLTGRVHEFGLGESAAQERLGGLTERRHRLRVGLTHSGAVVTARIHARGPGRQATRELEQTQGRILEAWAPYAYGTDDQTLAAATALLLRERGRTLATAESCTGGWLGKLIVDEPGASDLYAGGWVTYSDQLKTTCLGVEPGLLSAYGAVSEQAVRAMAVGALRASGADESLAVTGIAGPAGPSDAKPVGTVYIALARRDADGVNVCRFLFPGDRAAVRERAAKSALQMLRFALLGVDPPAPLLGAVPVEASSGPGGGP